MSKRGIVFLGIILLASVALASFVVRERFSRLEAHLEAMQQQVDRFQKDKVNKGELQTFGLALLGTLEDRAQQIERAREGAAAGKMRTAKLLIETGHREAARLLAFSAMADLVGIRCGWQLPYDEVVSIRLLPENLRPFFEDDTSPYRIFGELVHTTGERYLKIRIGSIRECQS